MIVDKTLDRLYLECISDLCEAIRELRARAGGRTCRTADNLGLQVDYHMEQYQKAIGS